MYYIKKPIPVEAFCFNESVKNNTIPKWFEDFNEKEIRIEGDKVRICILTLEGPMWCSGDDYIIRGVHGELYPCRRHVFLRHSAGTEKSQSLGQNQKPRPRDDGDPD